MYDEGLVSLTQFQQRNVVYQNVVAKKTSSENKVAQTKQEILSVQIEQQSVIQDYTEKLSKIEGDRFQSMGQVEGSTGEIAKLENQVSNYKARQQLYFVVASQDGQIVQAKKGGVGEMGLQVGALWTVFSADAPLTCAGKVDRWNVENAVGVLQLPRSLELLVIAGK
mgnify:CR=1 FL=1